MSNSVEGYRGFRTGSSASAHAQRTGESNRAMETGESSETRFVKKRFG